jgi:multimeric flavodoxin WrbA
MEFKRILPYYTKGRKMEKYRAIILNGSPKGPKSVSLQYAKYILQAQPTTIDYSVVHIAQLVQLYEKNAQKWAALMAQIKKADVIIWAFPLYYMLVHSNYKRFIELIFERKSLPNFEGKFTTTISTSIHFYDHTAHNYMQAICDDLQMKFIGSGSFHMGALRSKRRKPRVDTFADYFFNSLRSKREFPPRYYPIQYNIPVIDSLTRPNEDIRKIDTKNTKITIISDSTETDTNLSTMVNFLSQSLVIPPKIVNLWDNDISGPCLGCLQCGYDFTCRYQAKDGYFSMVENEIKLADILIFAGTMKDRYLSSRWKLFFDRFFYNGHTPQFLGKYLGYCISGPLDRNENLQEMLLSFAYQHGATPLGFVSDQVLNYGKSSEDLGHLLFDFLANLFDVFELGLEGTSFRKLGGKLLFRDANFADMSMVFQGDYRAYRKLGIFKTFPQRKRMMRMISAIMRFLRRISSKFRKGMDSQMTDYVVRPYRKLVEERKNSIRSEGKELS